MAFKFFSKNKKKTLRSLPNTRRRIQVIRNCVVLSSVEIDQTDRVVWNLDRHWWFLETKIQNNSMDFGQRGDDLQISKVRSTSHRSNRGKPGFKVKSMKSKIQSSSTSPTNIIRTPVGFCCDDIREHGSVWHSALVDTVLVNAVLGCYLEGDCICF